MVNRAHRAQTPAVTSPDEPLDLPARPRILVISLRRIGDVLLTTPLMRALRQRYPDAVLEALVFSGTEGILDGNPDLNGVIASPSRPTLHETFALVRRLWRRYDLVVSTQAGDRPTLLALMAGRHRAGLVPHPRDGGGWKRLLLHRAIPARDREHRVLETMRIAASFGLTSPAEIVCPAGEPKRAVASENYAVLHAGPMFAYRRWTLDGWRELARALSARGLAVVATGGPAETERAYLDELWSAAGVPVERLDGRLPWPQLTGLLAGARLYVGVDTSVTHLAAAAGCPTVALFGPTDPRLWGPWPVGGLDEMWAAAEPVQRRGNVWLVQNAFPCLPCQEEGCERRLDSHSACLDTLSTAAVLRAVDQALDLNLAQGASKAWRDPNKAAMQDAFEERTGKA